MLLLILPQSSRQMMGRRRGPAVAKSLALVPSSSSTTASAPAAPDDPPEEVLGGWTGWLLRNYAAVQILLTVNTALLWWLGTTDAVSTSLTYVFNSMRETFSGSKNLEYSEEDMK